MKAMLFSIRNPHSAICLFFAALHLHFGFERDGEVKDAGLVYRLDEAERFVEDAALVFGPVGVARDTAQVTRVGSGARWACALDRLACDGEQHRRDARGFK